ERGIGAPVALLVRCGTKCEGRVWCGPYRGQQLRAFDRWESHHICRCHAAAGVLRRGQLIAWPERLPVVGRHLHNPSPAPGSAPPKLIGPPSEGTVIRRRLVTLVITVAPWRAR